ncbi:polyprenyl diphosphate synthase [Cognatazoarcus halotolerans]|uniref:polyprenyl diphosphate synthase n=1 Tax=Cognatazoarcus halotolerans TaxID=2686016 RepID=UPI0013567919|nr:polyprenyl diphosphate synthase [Cognatazoarcus halotolerans]MBX3679006.1 di-trans,poly-cis-decaprenylcistransferase [Rhodocyclaceae bacterium]MCB1898117.1 di-trans,poly-cis-decaprenylcistransferase [Rhodocyclaceae bacterium]MCP5309001.1 di-trans,poly-cis-decaprenylcistransferase [Zoogloeaceae bacterium]
MANLPFSSSTTEIPQVGDTPRHVAIIMDGNGRWARKRLMPRVAGHSRGVEAVRGTIRACIDRGIPYLTLFAFSSENWRRPADEVSFLMQLFLRSLQKEIERMHANNIRFRVVGDLSRFEGALVRLIRDAEALTAGNSALVVTIAANYGGRWDILQAVDKMLAAEPEKRSGFSEENLAEHLALAYGPEPDLFIRTGGEQRISNFLLWQLAYSELYFTDTLWPDFDDGELQKAIAWYRGRERRFGRTSEQLSDKTQKSSGNA